MSENDDILALLAGNDAQQTTQIYQPPQPHIPERIRMTKGALNKAWAICDAVRKLGGSPHEWYGFLLASQSDPLYTVRDLHITHGTKVWHGFHELEGEMHAKATAEIEARNKEQGTDLYTIGWLHSHADFGVFHSATDDANFAQLLNTVTLNTQQRGYHPLNLFEEGLEMQVRDGGVSLVGKGAYDAMLHFVPQDEERIAELLKRRNGEPKEELLARIIDATALCTFEPRLIGFGYSVVVNDLRTQPYAEIRCIEKLPFSKKDQFLPTNKTSVELVDVPDDVTYTIPALEAIVKERIVFMTKKPVQATTTQKSSGRFWQRRSKEGKVTTLNIGYQGNGYQPPKQKIVPKMKREEGTLLSDLTRAFTTSAAAYMSRFQYDDVQYSEWLDDVLHWADSHKKLSLGEAIYLIGNPQPDGSEVTEPRTQRWAYGLLSDQFIKEGPKSADHPEIKFMGAFVFGNPNEAIRDMAPAVVAYYDELEKIAKAQEEDQTPSNGLSAAAAQQQADFENANQGNTHFSGEDWVWPE